MNDKRQVALVYSCDSDIYVWDISTKEYAITPLEAKRRIESGLGQPRVPITSQRTTAISASLGGVVGAWTLKDAVAAIEAGNGKKTIIAAVIGAMSGYAVGYTAGSHSLRDLQN
jgi:outer membrane lipoprotein SlyB